MKNFFLALFGLTMTLVSGQSSLTDCAGTCTSAFLSCTRSSGEGVLSELCLENMKQCKVDCLRGEPEALEGSVERYIYGDNPVQSKRGVSVKGVKCWACRKAASKIEGVIASRGCLTADLAITGACEAAFLGPFDPLSEICAVGFIAACPTFTKWIEEKIFTADKACHHLRMC